MTNNELALDQLQAVAGGLLDFGGTQFRSLGVSPISWDVGPVVTSERSHISIPPIPSPSPRRTRLAVAERNGMKG